MISDERLAFGMANGSSLDPEEVEQVCNELWDRRERERWIPVEEKLPEKSSTRWRGVRVLAAIRLTQSVKELSYQEHNKDGNWYFFDGEWPYEVSEITHWRPLPASPKEGANE